MILILSEEKDLTTHEVCDWLLYKDSDYVRLNGETEIDFPSIEINAAQGRYQIEVKKTKKVIDLAGVTSFWYRRGYLNRKISGTNIQSQIKLTTAINRFLYQEIDQCRIFTYHLLNEKPGIGSYFHNYRNKLQHLLSAERLGLSIPPSTILTKKEALLNFRKKHGELIVKALHNGFTFLEGQLSIEGYTCLLDKQTISELPDQFFPSFFQKNIPKRMDIRIFYLNGQFYSSAILSQRDAQTKVDVRRYNNEKPNRVIPFQIPKEIEQKLDRLMHLLQMKSGSIDLVYGADKQFYFLEINPIGQFAQVSYPCNYYLEELVAKELIHLSKNKHEK